MNSVIKKRLYSLTIATVLSITTTFATTFDNNIVDIQFTESDGEITATIITEKGYEGQVKATKSGGYYNIILPNVGKGSKSLYHPSNKNIDFVKVVTLTSSTGGDAYTKISIKMNSNSILKAINKIKEDLPQEEQNQTNTKQRPIVEQELYNPTKEEPEPESTEEEFVEEEIESENPPTPDELMTKNISEKQIDTTSSNANTPKTNTYKRDHSSEILSLLIGSVAVLLIVVLLYIKGKDKIRELCGDMDISIDDTKSANNKKKQKKETKKEIIKEKEPQKINSIEKSLLDLSDYDKNKTNIETKEIEKEEEKAVIDLDEIYTGPMSSIQSDYQSNQSQETDEDDIDDFLASFVDKDEEQDSNEEQEYIGDITKEAENESTEDSEPIEKAEENNPIDNLIDDVIATQNMEFSDADLALLQEQLQTDLSPEIIEQTNQNKQPKERLLTLEDFDKKYPLLSDEVIDSIIKRNDIKFNDIDINVIFSPITSYEMSEDAIIEAQMRKEKEDEENIQYYENEKDFAFTLIKTQDVENPNELVVLDDNLYPDLANVDFSNDAIFKEFSFVKDETSEEAPSNEDIEKAIAKEMELINNEQTDKETDNSILSEYKLIKPEDTNKLENDQFTTTVFTSMDDIENQFKALGLDFNKKEPQPDETEVENSSTIESESKEIIDTNAEIIASCNIDFATELYLTRYEDKVQLVGIKKGETKILHTFDSTTEPKSLTARKAEETETGEARYIIRADKEKFVVDITENDIKMVLAL